MDVDELIATLKHGRPLCSFEVDGAIELVERLKSENDKLRQAMEWISVDDRLPEISTPVCLLLQHGETGRTWETFGYLDDEGWMIYSQSVLDVLPDTNYHIRKYAIVLWQPLPPDPTNE